MLHFNQHDNAIEHMHPTFATFTKGQVTTCPYDPALHHVNHHNLCIYQTIFA